MHTIRFARSPRAAVLAGTVFALLCGLFGTFAATAIATPQEDPWWPADLPPCGRVIGAAPCLARAPPAPAMRLCPHHHHHHPGAPRRPV